MPKVQHPAFESDILTAPDAGPWVEQGWILLSDKVAAEVDPTLPCPPGRQRLPRGVARLRLPAAECRRGPTRGHPRRTQGLLQRLVNFLPATGGRATDPHGLRTPRESWAFEMFEAPHPAGSSLPNAQITEVGAVSYADEDLIAYPVTLEAFEDAAGNNSYEYTDDGVFV